MSLRPLFIQAWCVFSFLRSLGYPSDELFFGSIDGIFRVQLQHGGMKFVVNVNQEGVINDTFSDQAVNAQWSEFASQVNGYHGDESFPPEFRQAFDEWRAKYALPLLTRLTVKGIYPP